VQTDWLVEIQRDGDSYYTTACWYFFSDSGFGIGILVDGLPGFRVRSVGWFDHEDRSLDKYLTWLKQWHHMAFFLPALMVLLHGFLVLERKLLWLVFIPSTRLSSNHSWMNSCSIIMMS
jgi:hypothetical protein